MVRHPSLVLCFTLAHGGNTPICNVSRDTCATPIKTHPQKQTRTYFAILSLQVPRDMKSISVGPLRLHDAQPNFSVVALGNRFWHPPKQFPAWIAPAERNGLFWASRTQGRHLAAKVALSSGLLGAAIAKRLGLRAAWVIWRWQSAGGWHGVLARTVVQQTACMKGIALWSMAMLTLFLNWDLVHKCPQTLMHASACLRGSSAVRTVVTVSCWVLLTISSGWMRAPLAQTASSFIYKDPKVQGVVARSLGRTCCVLLMALMLSSLAAVHQASKSIPGFFGVGGRALQAVSLCLGVVQSAICTMVVPVLTKKFAPDMRFLEGVLNLLSSCVIPGLVVVFLDNACLQCWTAVWQECSGTRAAKFHQKSVVTYVFFETREDMGIVETSVVDVLTTNDICKPHRSTSTSTCFQTVLVSMQGFWLSKWVASAFSMPFQRLVRDSLPSDPVEVLQSMTLALQYALIVSAPLPMLGPLLLLAAFSGTLLAATGWEQRVLQIPERLNGDVTTASWMIARLCVVIVLLAFTGGDLMDTAVSMLIVFLVYQASFGHHSHS